MLENCLYHVILNANPTHIIATIINWIDELVSLKAIISFCQVTDKYAYEMYF